MSMKSDYFEKHGLRLWNLKYSETKSDWEWLMTMRGADYLPNLYAKPAAPAMKRWRRLRNALIRQTIKENRNDKTK